VQEEQSVSKIPDDAIVIEIDTTASHVLWTGSKPTGQHTGTIAISSGRIALLEDSIVGGDILINLEKIDVLDLKDDPEDYQRLVDHLRSDDFFDVTQYPMATFTITQVQPFSSADTMKVKEDFETEYAPKTSREHMVDSPTHWITGNLTMRGTTLSITFPARITRSDGVLTAEAKFNIDRTLWGLMYKNEGDIRDKARDSFIYNTVNTGFILRAPASPNL
jgi:polyisoprenoid-binding protein YceI